MLEIARLLWAVGVGHTEGMTEQEAEAWAARLGRIWQPVRAGRYRLDQEGNFDWAACLQYLQGHAQSAQIRHSVDLQVSFYADVSEPLSFNLKCKWGGQTSVGDLSVTDEGGIEQDTWGKVARREFAQRVLTEWIPFFRRGCWLSGCDVEASAHEKVEWIQGFGREEIESWNLKM